MLKTKSKISGGIFDIDAKKETIQRLEKQSSEPDFWNENEKAQAILKELTKLREWTESWEEVDSKRNELSLLLDLANEEKDDETFAEVSSGLEKLEKAIDEMELRRMLGAEDDSNNAILTIHPGTGGT